jgi:hypothetical protein
VDLGRAEDYSLHYLSVEALGDNEVEVTVVEDVVGPLDTAFTKPSVGLIHCIRKLSKKLYFRVFENCIKLTVKDHTKKCQ